MISNFPPKNNRRVWQRHFGAQGLSGDSYLLYYKALPRAAFIEGGGENDWLRYFSDRTLFEVPPLWLIMSDESGTRILKYDNNKYHQFAGPVEWSGIRESRHIRVTRKSAGIIVDRIFLDHKKWLEDPLSIAAIGSIPRIFSECTALIYELVQNAFDANATRVKIELDHDTLRFYHDGNNFTEADANAISFVNLSSKDRDKTGFMGIGFKSVFEASDKPEIQSEPFSFFFDNHKQGGYILPQKAEKKPVPGMFTTLVHIPLKGRRIHELIDEELTPEEKRESGLGFSRKTFLHLLREKDGALAGITDVETPYIKFKIVEGDLQSSYKIVDIDGGSTENRRLWLYFERRFRPGRYEVADFLRNRAIENKELEKEGWDESVSIMVPLAERDAGYSPAEDYEGILNVYLPTKIETGLGFDLQGNFIIQAGREKLKNIGGEWNRELFSHFGELVIKMLEWCKVQGANSRVNLADFYSLIPDWDNLEFLPQDMRDDMKKGFSKLINAHELIPTESKGRGGIVFKRPEECIIVDDVILDLLGAEAITRVSGKKVVLRTLEGEARRRLLESTDVTLWDVEKTVEFLSKKSWFRALPGFRSRRAWNRWLSRLHTYLRTFLPERRWEDEYTDNKDRVLGCYIFPTGWSDSKKRYVLSRYKLPDEKLYRLPRERAKLPLEAFRNRVHLLDQSFEDYIRGRPGKMTDEERSVAEETRAFLERVNIQTLEPDVIVKDFISPLFSDPTEHPKKALVEYTCFVCDHKKDIKKSSIQIMLLNRKGEFLHPSNLIMGKEYGVEDLETFFGGADDEVFVSGVYLEKVSISSKQWVDLFLSLGVKNTLPLKITKEVVPQHSINERLGKHSEDFEDKYLRSSRINADFPGSSFLVIDIDFSDPVKGRLEAIMKLTLMSKLDSMRAFLRLLDVHWEQKYSKRLKVKVKYYVSGQRADSGPYSRTTGMNTKLATYLLDEHWVAATNSDNLRKADQVVALSEENAALSDEGVVLCAEKVKNEDLLKFLKFRPAPEGVTTLHRLINLKNAGSQNLERYKELYGLTGTETDEGKLTVKEVRREFSDNKLVYANGKFWAPEDVMFNPPTALKLHYPLLNEIYPDLKEFFCKVLGCDDDSPSIEKILLYFHRFLWVTGRGMDDTLRASVLYSYRRLLDYVGEQESNSYQNTPLWQKFIKECKVFCKGVGWTSSRTDKAIIFLDVPKYEDHFLRSDKVHVESHLSQMNRDTGDLIPLLELLNVKPASQFVKESISTSGEIVHENMHGIERNINVLFDSIIDALSNKYQDSNRKERTELNKFIEKLREFTKRRKVVYRADSITSRISLDGAVLFKVVKACHIKDEGATVKILLSDDLRIIYGQLCGELCGMLGTALLPGNIQKVVCPMIERTVGNIEGNIQKSIETVYRDLGLGPPSDDGMDTEVKEEDEKQVTEDDTDDGESSPAEPSEEDEKKSYDDITEPIDFSDVSLVTVNSDDVSLSDPKQDVDKGGGEKGRTGKKHFTPNPYSVEDGKRGEEVALKKEEERLTEIGLADYISKIVHISRSKRGHPWDIDSFDKKTGTGEVIPIRIEVKATPDPQNLVFPMSEPEFRAALNKEHPKGPYFIYRVFSVRSAKPRIRRYEFLALYNKNKISIKKAKDFYFELPDRDEGHKSPDI